MGLIVSKYNKQLCLKRVSERRDKMLRREKVISVISIISIVGLFGSMPVGAQPGHKTALARLERLSDRGKFLKQRLGKRVNHLSTGGKMIVNFGEQWGSIKPILERVVEQGGFLKERGMDANVDKFMAPLAPFTGNNPFAKSDFFSRFAGSTQNETSVGWWRNNAVCGFNDTGSFAATFLPLFDPTLPPSPSPSGSFSFIGWSRSSKAGAAFTDKGILVADPIPDDIDARDLLGDPVVRATSSSTFYYASIAQDIVEDEVVGDGISISKSTNGGFSWGGSVMVSVVNGGDFLDKPWMAVKPGSPDSIYVTYTKFDFGVTSDITRIELVKSADGGVTWSKPVKIVEGSERILVTNSQIAVGPTGEIYVAWEEFDESEDRSIKIRKSIDDGKTFSDKVEVSSVIPVGDSFLLQGGFRANFDLQGLAVDTSGTATNGNVYVVWHDGRNLAQSDFFAFDGQYHFADILFSKSTDGGNTWSVPVRINNDPITRKADQFMPAIAVDKTGKIGILYYDRKYNLRNFLIDVTIATSKNAGATWTNSKVTKKSFAPIPGVNDFFVDEDYMGDYIAIAQDASKTNNGFIGAWGDNSLGDANIGVAKIK